MTQDPQEDILLHSQLNTEFDDSEFQYKEQVFTYCINAMILDGSDILGCFHDLVFPAKGEKPYEVTFETIQESLEDIVKHTFCILNQLAMDTPQYSEVMEVKEGIPALSRGDKNLAVLGLIQAVTDLANIIWHDLDSGNKTVLQADLDNASDSSEGIGDDIMGAVSAILALTDTLCQHMGKSLRDLL